MGYLYYSSEAEEVDLRKWMTRQKQLKKEKEATEDKVKMGIKHIRMIIRDGRERMRTKVDDCSAVVGNRWSKQAAEL